MLNTWPCAFSISSNNTTEYGRLRTFSLSCPPSSYPTYPGGEPIILETLCFSIYSDMSTRIISLSCPNTASASALESSVLPTPVGPKNRKEPIGRFGSFIPTRPRRTALATAFTASSWPTTLSCSISSKCFNRSVSASCNFCTGIFVQSAITSATSFSVTTSLFFWRLASACACIWSIVSCNSFCCLLISPASAKSSAMIASSFFCSNSCFDASNLLSSGVGKYTLNPALADASSITSIALSGKKRSLT